MGRLKAIQAAHGWTDQEMADRMGVSRPMWLAAKEGTALGMRSIKAILRGFPELEQSVMDYLKAAA